MLNQAPVRAALRISAAFVLLHVYPLTCTAQVSTPSASGHGQITDGKETQVISFTTMIQADGSETGQAELFNRTSGLRLHVDVDCVLIVGNAVTFSGQVTQSTDPKFINDQVLVQAVDNGEGVEDKPDTVSSLQIADQLKCISCKTPLKFQQTAIERGNIQVRK